jgi:hypothetical protein
MPVHDPRSGAPINSNLADYILTTHADAPPHMSSSCGIPTCT